MLPQNWGEPMGAPAIFEKTNGNQALTPCIHFGVTDSGNRYLFQVGWPLN
ncbi:MAG: hypothetical protein P8X74_13180 [Reinekea sp.]